MKLGFLTACLPKRSLGDIAAWASDHGYEALEVAAWPALGDRPFTATHLDPERYDRDEVLGLFADRTSCHHFVANQFWVLLTAAAYVLMSHLRRVALPSTELAHADVSTIRQKLFKIGAWVGRSVRRLVLRMATSYPWQATFRVIVERLRAAAPPAAPIPLPSP